jgi:hypothetical protein
MILDIVSIFRRTRITWTFGLLANLDPSQPFQVPVPVFFRVNFPKSRLVTDSVDKGNLKFALLCFGLLLGRHRGQKINKIVSKPLKYITSGNETRYVNEVVSGTALSATMYTGTVW